MIATSKSSNAQDDDDDNNNSKLNQQQIAANSQQQPTTTGNSATGELQPRKQEDDFYLSNDDSSTTNNVARFDAHCSAPSDADDDDASSCSDESLLSSHSSASSSDEQLQGNELQQPQHCADDSSAAKPQLLCEDDAMLSARATRRKSSPAFLRSAQVRHSGGDRGKLKPGRYSHEARRDSACELRDTNFCAATMNDLWLVNLKGVIVMLPQIFNAFQHPRLEHSYQRYSHGQRQRSLAISHSIDLVLKAAMLALTFASVSKFQPQTHSHRDDRHSNATAAKHSLLDACSEHLLLAWRNSSRNAEDSHARQSPSSASFNSVTQFALSNRATSKLLIFDEQNFDARDKSALCLQLVPSLEFALNLKNSSAELKFARTQQQQPQALYEALAGGLAASASRQLLPWIALNLATIFVASVLPKCLDSLLSYCALLTWLAFSLQSHFLYSPLFESGKVSVWREDSATRN